MFFPVLVFCAKKNLATLVSALFLLHSSQTINSVKSIFKSFLCSPTKCRAQRPKTEQQSDQMRL
jgi:hypothetical protein